MLIQKHIKNCGPPDSENIVFFLDQADDLCWVIKGSDGSKKRIGFGAKAKEIAKKEIERRNK